MARYPTFPSNFNGITDNGLRELQTRDIDIDSTPSTNIYTVVTISDIGRPRKGDIAYFSSVGKFKGYVSLGSETSWQDLN